MAAHHWQDIEPPTFFAEAFCERCGLRRHVLGLEKAVFVEEGAKRSGIRCRRLTRHLRLGPKAVEA
jgi:hypothetical protein